MISIKIKSLYLENFKCHRHLRLSFDGADISIYGDNATGKTSIYDALTWLLFGKDSSGNGEKNVEIKPLNADGEVQDHQAMTIVEAVLLVGEEDLTLRRTYREVWTTRRGSSEAVFDGNTSEYYINEVPCKRNAFQDKVNELVSEDTFRMLTSVSHFAGGISWQDRRSVLFNIAGVMDDKQIMATDDRFAALAESMGRLSLGDYKKKLAAEKKKFAGAQSDIPARISECQKTIEDVEALDFAAARAELEKLSTKKDELSSQILAIENDTAISKKRMEVRELQMELSKLESENNIFRKSQTAGVVNVVTLEKEVEHLRATISRQKQLLKNEQSLISHLEGKIEASRKRWLSVSNEAFSGGICNSCGQTLPADRLQQAEEVFEASRRRHLRDIEVAASSDKEALQFTQRRIDTYKEDIQGLQERLHAKELEVAAEKNTVITISDMDGYADRKASLKALISRRNDELSDMANNTILAKGALREQLCEVAKGVKEQNAILSKEALLDYSQKRIEALREDARNAAERLEAIEKMLFLVEQYTRYKTCFVEDNINSLFRLAKFRLFREQANGGIEDRCDVVHNGVPYTGLNNGMRINVGVDIINTLSRHYGVTVPLFIDNAEAVTRLEPCAAQVIRLVVSEEDKELRLV